MILCKGKKFTLIELLVVVAIIGILASILLPSLAKAREKAYEAVCRNNVKQTELGNIMYADNYNGWYVPNLITSANDNRWAKNTEFRELMGWTSESQTFMIPNASACPKGRQKALADGVDYSQTALKDLRSYGPIAIYGVNTNPYRGAKEGWIDNPSDMAHVGDVYGGWQFAVGEYDARHDGRAIMVFFDGHVEPIRGTVLGSSWNSGRPWVDSSGYTMTQVINNSTN
jgi:prepilin-type N-terminal cleavage/methylation domain-containing protein/prepilin-type processing-associated H-X9-DG protein